MPITSDIGAAAKVSNGASNTKTTIHDDCDSDGDGNDNDGDKNAATVTTTVSNDTHYGKHRGIRVRIYSHQPRQKSDNTHDRGSQKRHQLPQQQQQQRLYQQRQGGLQKEPQSRLPSFPRQPQKHDFVPSQELSQNARRSDNSIRTATNEIKRSRDPPLSRHTVSLPSSSPPLPPPITSFPTSSSSLLRKERDTPRYLKTSRPRKNDPASFPPLPPRDEAKRRLWHSSSPSSPFSVVSSASSVSSKERATATTTAPRTLPPSQSSSLSSLPSISTTGSRTGRTSRVTHSSSFSLPPLSPHDQQSSYSDSESAWSYQWPTDLPQIETRIADDPLPAYSFVAPHTKTFWQSTPPVEVRERVAIIEARASTVPRKIDSAGILRILRRARNALAASLIDFSEADTAATSAVSHALMPLGYCASHASTGLDGCESVHAFVQAKNGTRSDRSHSNNNYNSSNSIGVALETATATNHNDATALSVRTYARAHGNLDDANTNTNTYANANVNTHTNNDALTDVIETAIENRPSNNHNNNNNNNGDNTNNTNNYNNSNGNGGSHGADRNNDCTGAVSLEKPAAPWMPLNGAELLEAWRGRKQRRARDLVCMLDPSLAAYGIRDGNVTASAVAAPLATSRAINDLDPLTVESCRNLPDSLRSLWSIGALGGPAASASACLRAAEQALREFRGRVRYFGPEQVERLLCGNMTVSLTAALCARPPVSTGGSKSFASRRNAVLGLADNQNRDGADLNPPKRGNSTTFEHRYRRNRDDSDYYNGGGGGGDNITEHSCNHGDRRRRNDVDEDDVNGNPFGVSDGRDRIYGGDYENVDSAGDDDYDNYDDDDGDDDVDDWWSPLLDPNETWSETNGFLHDRADRLYEDHRQHEKSSPSHVPSIATVTASTAARKNSRTNTGANLSAATRRWSMVTLDHAPRHPFVTRNLESAIRVASTPQLARAPLSRVVSLSAITPAALWDTDDDNEEYYSGDDDFYDIDDWDYDDDDDGDDTKADDSKRGGFDYDYDDDDNNNNNNDNDDHSHGDEDDFHNDDGRDYQSDSSGQQSIF